MISDYFPKMALLMIAILAIAAADAAPAAKDNKPKEVDAALFLAPFNNSLSIDAGTIEIRFCLNYSFDECLRPETSKCLPFAFLQIYEKDGTLVDVRAPLSIASYQNRSSHSILFYNNVYYLEKDTQPVTRNYTLGLLGNKERGIWFSENEWHSLVVTWKVENNALNATMFLDGNVCSSKKFPIKDNDPDIRQFSKDDMIGIGGISLSPATILSYRISNRVRTKEEIVSKEPLKPDEATTFFLSGDTAAKCGKADRKDFLAMSKKGQIDVGKNGTFFGKFKIVNTPNGKAIQFFDKLSR